MKNFKAVAICATVGVALAGVSIAAPAWADPVANSYVLVGSDTLQDVSNALINGTNVSGAFVQTLPDDGAFAGATMGSFDAFGSAAIQTRGAGVRFGRPAGSGEGVKALSRSIDGAAFQAAFVAPATVAQPSAVITGQVDIARSSSAPSSANILASGPLAYVPFARDAVSFAYFGSGLGTITLEQLTAIYSCTSAPQINGVTVIPLLPQAGSGTRKFFLGAIGVSDAAATTCVSVTNGTSTSGNASKAENDGTVLDVAGQIIPFSVANWVAQSNGAAPARLGAATLGTTNGTAPYTGTGSALSSNPTFFADAKWGRDTYMVVEYARINSATAGTVGSKFDQGLFDLLDPSVPTSLTNVGTFGATSGAVKAKFGFLAPASSTIIRAKSS